MKKTLVLFSLLSITILSCRKDAVISSPATVTAIPQTDGIRVIIPGSSNTGDESRIPAGYESTVCAEPLEKAFMAGQSINTGTVTVWNNESTLYVAYQLDGNYQLKKTHLFVGGCNAIQVNNAGNPRIGQYPMQTTHAAGTQVWVYAIPLSSLPAGCLCISAHAEVGGYNSSGQTFNETGWAQGEQINDGGSWAMKFGYCLLECDGNPR